MAEGGAAEQQEKAELLSAIANDDVPQMLAVLRRADGNSLMSSVGSALHVATMYGSPGCTKQLLADQATIDCCDKDGHTPLHYAAVEGDAEVVQLLIDARADLFFPTRDVRARLMGGGLSIDMAGGRTALHLAAENGNPEAAAALVGACGALAAVLDLDGATAWDVALREGAKNGGHVSKSRLAVAELLHPGKAPPSCEELRALAAHDAAQRKRRLDDLEAQQKQQAALRKEMRGLPADHGYQSPWPQLYTGLDLRQYLSPPLAAALALPTQARAKALQALCEQIAPEVFALRVFPEDEEGLTARLLEELTAIERWATQSAWELSRPNSMNRYGLVLRDVGLDFFLQTLQAQCVRPLASALWPEKYRDLSEVHGFTVRYKEGEDRLLETHVDSSELTLNLCLGGSFQGGGVYFHGHGSSDPMETPHPANCTRCLATHCHQPGVALLHDGRCIHGAQPLSAGERTNLVLWCRAPAALNSDLPELD